jgi:hypothetical protein
MSIEAKPTVQKAVRPTQKTVARRAATRKRVQTGHKTAPQKLKLLFTVVNRSKAEFYIDFLHSFEVNMQMTMAAYGTASTEMLSYLGLTNNEKALIISVIRDDMEKAALDALEEKFNTIKNGKGIAYTVPMTSTIGVAIYQFLCNNPTK